MLYTNILLDGQPAGGGASGLIMIVVLIVVFYFFMIRPQQKRQKKLKQEREAMKKNDTVVTAGGIYGRIVEVNDQNNTFVVEIDKNVKIRIDKNSVYPSAEQANEAAAQNGEKK